MIFPCTKCGLCCQNISSIPELKDYDLGTGICKYFDSITNGCEIYENRPLICRVDKMFDLKYHKFFSKNEFYILNAKVCNELQEKYNTDLADYTAVVKKSETLAADNEKISTEFSDLKTQYELLKKKFKKDLKNT